MSTPRLVGRYEFIRLVGKGGFGVVEEYRDLLTGEEVAIKKVPARFVDQESKRLIREIDTMLFLHDAHPHVIGFFNMFVTPCNDVESRLVEDGIRCGGSAVLGEGPQSLDVESPAYAGLSCTAALFKHHNQLEAEVAKIRGCDKFNLHIVMPLMKGDLLHFINHASPAGLNLSVTDDFIEQVFAVVAFQICFGLDYLHKCNIVHRDMKPENILIRLHNTNPYESTALIADLGLARDAQASDTFYVCTRYYRPPEIITTVSRGETSIDVWSLGCILFEMVTGRALFTVSSALNEHGVWEGHRASTQLEVILNTIGTPSHDAIKQFMPAGNAQLYLLRSAPRPSRLMELMRNNWRLHTTRGRQAKWMDLIFRCLVFFPEQRPTCEELCRHQLFRDFNVFYGENVIQYPARVYQPAQVGALVVENKEIILRLARRALVESAPYTEEGAVDETGGDEEDSAVVFGNGPLQREERAFEEGNERSPMAVRFASAQNDVSRELDLKNKGTLKEFPHLSDPELRRQYTTNDLSGDALDHVVSSLLNDLQYHTHDPERSEQLRALLDYFASLR
ncbi:protein kinase [Trypanosoma rangeli SC58]|uniref:Protein kinase n=1 Tax=Trypanosoma rangeli SC58 TaxID=429131 RepID=A0A061J5I5_TRYRA|nr:protein kinase [Trypanosoma rangeli SC58]